MEYRNLGKSGPEVSAICFGCWAIGGAGPEIDDGWGEVDDNESIEAIRKALDLGINFFDTADIYGRGHSEEVLGKALGKEKEKVVIGSKVGYDWNRGRINGEKSYILSSCEGSLRHLGRDYIDLYQIHCYDTDTPISETFEALIELKKAGKIRYIGVSNNYDIPQMEEALEFTHIDSLQPCYSMLQRESEKFFSFCLRKGIGVITYSSIAKGLLTGKFSINTELRETDIARRRDELFRGENFRKNLDIIEKLKPLTKECGKSLTQLAIAWVLSHRAVTSAIVGAKRASQIEENAGGAGWKIPDEQKAQINSIFCDSDSSELG